MNHRKCTYCRASGKLIAIRHKPAGNTTAEVVFNNGWQLNFRIHNASTYVETSLKFDIQFVGMPTSILKIACNRH